MAEKEFTQICKEILGNYQDIKDSARVVSEKSAQAQSAKTKAEQIQADVTAKNIQMQSAITTHTQKITALNTRIDETTPKLNEMSVFFTTLPTKKQELTTLKNEAQQSKNEANLRASEITTKLNQFNTDYNEVRYVKTELPQLNNAVREGLADIANIKSLTTDGFIKDDSVSTTQTYSSQKLNALFDTKLDVTTYTAQKQTFATKTELNTKLATATYNTDKPTFATKTELNTKLATATYNADKATFATKTELNTKLNANANAVSATKLQTARTINGVAFDGTANITIADNTKLATATYNAEKQTFATKTELNTKLATATYNAEKQTPITNHIIWSIGASQKEGAVKHFTDFNAVFTEALKYRKATHTDRYIQLHLTSDIVINQQVYVSCCDLSFLRIYGGRTTADNGFKIIAGPNLPANHYLFFFDLGTKAPFFYGVTFKGRWLPNSGARPTAAATNSVNTNGIRISGFSQAIIFDKCKFENLNEAIRCQNASYAYFGNAITEFNMCNIGINAYDLAYVILSTPTFQNCIKAVRPCSGTQIYCFKCVFKKNNLAIATETNATTTLYLCTLPPNTDA
ncbi:hypothetical protein, partial [Campylobacter gastrosuis]